MLINVTQDDIDQGLKHGAKSCPIARAIKRGSNLEGVIVGLRHVHIKQESVYKDYEIPYEASNFIFDFDHDVKVKPFSFELEWCTC